MTEQSENAGGEGLQRTPPYTGTTSDGVRTGGSAPPLARPPSGVKPPSAAVKPPSAAFGKAGEGAPVRVPSAPVRVGSEKPSSPVGAEGGDGDEVGKWLESCILDEAPQDAQAVASASSGPEEEEPVAEPTSSPPARVESDSVQGASTPAPSPTIQAAESAPSAAGAAPSGPSTNAPMDERLQAEILELADVLFGLDKLSFLRPRVEKFKTEGADHASLVSVYRLTARSLKEALAEQDKMMDSFRKEYQKMKTALDEARKSQPPPSRTISERDQESPDIEGLKKQIQSLTEQLEQAGEQRNRLLQDFQNMRNRVQVDTELRVHREKENLIKKLLEVVDGFHRAIDTVKTSKETDEVARGLEMLFRIMMETLEAEGLKLVEALGRPFDPRCHEAMGQVQTRDVPEDHVYDVLQTGYYLGERLLRPAMVRVATAPPGSPPPAPPPAADQPKASPEGEENPG